MPPEAPEGAPNVMYIVIDDIGFGWIEPFGGRDPHAEHRPARAERSALHELHDDRAVLTDALVPADRPQPPLGGDGQHHRAGDRVPGLQRPPAAEQGRRSGRCSTTTATRASASASGTTRRRRRRGSRGPYDRWPTGPVFGFDRFYGFFGGDSDQWYPKLFIDREPIDQPRLPEEGYHLSEDLAERTMSWLAQHKSLAPRQAVAGATSRSGRCTRRTTSGRSGRTATRASSTWAGTPTARRCSPGRRSWASSPTQPSCRRCSRASRRGTASRPTSSGSSPGWPRSTPATWSTPTRRSAGSSTSWRRPASSTTRCCSCSSATTAPPARAR